VDPNTLFVNVETIKRAIDEAAKARELAKEKEPAAEAEAQRVFRALGQVKMEACIFEW
jgi:hypothetical protein